MRRALDRVAKVASGGHFTAVRFPWWTVEPEDVPVLRDVIGACQGSCPIDHHETGVAIAGVRTSCLIGLRKTGPIGVQLRVLPVQRLGFTLRAAA